MTHDINWTKLGFHYTEPEYIVRAGYHDGAWGEPYATPDKYLHLHVSATCLQYGQEAFEGLKAFRGVDGKIRIFRWRENAKRMARSAEGLYMAPVPEDLFGRAIYLALEKNIDLVPPYGTGATLYFRPLLIGTTPRLGVGAGRDFEFIVIPSPIGAYYPGKFHCTTFIVNRSVDRAAPLGTGSFKVGGNYAASFRATEPAHQQGMDCLFLDAKYHRYIDECAAANFIGIKKTPITGHTSQIEYLTPRSSAILPSITNDSLMTLAREKGYKVTRRHIRLEELSDMTEAAACGTAAVISPIDKVIDPEKNHIYHISDEPGEILTDLYHSLKDIQYGRAEDKHGWTEVFTPSDMNRS